MPSSPPASSPEDQAGVPSSTGSAAKPFMSNPGERTSVSGGTASRRCGYRVEQGAEGDPALQPGERRAQAVVDAVPERDVGDVGAASTSSRCGSVQRAGSRPAAVRPASTISPAGIVTAPTVDRCGGHVGQRHLERVRRAAAPPRRRPAAGPAGPQQSELVRVREQRVRTVRDEVDGGLVAGGEEQEPGRGQLVLVEPVRPRAAAPSRAATSADSRSSPGRRGVVRRARAGARACRPRRRRRRPVRRAPR